MLFRSRAGVRGSGARRRPGRKEDLVAGGLIARVSLPARFSFDAVVRSHGWYDLPPFSYDRERGTLQTVVETATGALEITFRVRNGKLEARAEGIDSRALRATARRVFSLDLDFAGAQQSLASAPELARALDRKSVV